MLNNNHYGENDFPVMVVSLERAVTKLAFMFHKKIFEIILWPLFVSNRAVIKRL